MSLEVARSAAGLPAAGSPAGEPPDADPPAAGSLALDLVSRLATADISLRDRLRLERRLRRLGTPGHRADPSRLEVEIGRAEERIARRRAGVPDVVPTYPLELPVSQHREELLAAIAAHQVVIVAGETGSGKTTQLPKMCLELGRGVRGTIAHTQPRRIAARTVAARIAEELHVPLGGPVGYAVRFDDRVGDETVVKLMTDGVLLAELPRDRRLSGYDTVIVDEAHERSLNIDFLLGYLAGLLPQRPELKVIVTSATIDTARFAEHFGGAPVVEVSGRSYPVEVRYRPLDAPAVPAGGDRPLDAPAVPAGGDAPARLPPGSARRVPGATRSDPRDQTEAIVDAVGELVAESSGDVLVFLAGEREIRDTADALRAAELVGTEILPLYARLSAAEQHRVFRAHSGRRVVLATNVAETSITVPGIRAVIDPGFARISRYSPRTKVQRLPIEPISRASADQRAGRCGRIGPGVCIRLYSEADYEGRPEFTDPEITRTNLASVILQMAALGLGDVSDFPFLDPPDRRQIAAANDLLSELGALDTTDGRHRLTTVGRRLARLPVDPRLGRMVLEADRNGCVRETIVVAAALSIQDPRERPAEHRQAADEAHRRFEVPGSDLLAYLRLWEYLQGRQRELSSSAFRRMCRREHLNFQRVREWEDLCTQLRQVCRDLGIRMSHEPADPDAVHRSVLAGLLSHIGLLVEDSGERRGARARGGPRQREYLGARGTRFTLGRGSVLTKSPPRWVMAAQLVETERLWARDGARIDPRWAERLGGHLLQRSYSEPRWDRRRAAAVATLTATLYGVPVVTGRSVDYTRVDPGTARELFVRHALVEHDWDTHHRFVEDNRRARDAVIAVEERVRRRDLLVDDETLEEVLDERVPAGIATGRDFDRWWRDARLVEPGRMTLRSTDLVRPAAGRVRFEDYPDVWVVGGLRLELGYRYAPLEDDDGVTVTVPLAALPALPGADLSWHLPGYRPELVAALLRQLPKDARRSLGPVPEAADAFLAAHGPGDGHLLDVLAGWVISRSGATLPTRTWDRPEDLPAYLRPRYSVVDGHGRELACSRDLPALRRRLRGPLDAAVSAAGSAYEHPPSPNWDFGDVPDRVEVIVAGQRLFAYPGLVEEGPGAAVRVFTDPAERDAAAWPATRTLLLLSTNPPTARAARSLPEDAKLALGQVPHASLAAFLEDCAGAAVDQLLASAGGPVRAEADWVALLGAVRAGLGEATTRAVTRAALVVSYRRVVAARLDRLEGVPALGSSVADMRAQLDRLAGPGFVTRTGSARLIDVVRYLKAAAARIDKLREDPLRDRERMRPVQALEAELDAVTGPGDWVADPRAAEVRWMLEELRVAIWAQSLGTAAPVSEARVRRAIARL